MSRTLAARDLSEIPKLLRYCKAGSALTVDVRKVAYRARHCRSRYAAGTKREREREREEGEEEDWAEKMTRNGTT